MPIHSRCISGSASTLEDLTLDDSASNGKTYSVQAMKTITAAENGKSVQKSVPVPPDEYTTLWWTIKALPAGQEVSVGYRVTIN